MYFPETKIVPSTFPAFESMKIVVTQETTVDAIFEAHSIYGESVCALNFASYKNPGGMFIEGSMAQEESLCHEGTLYNVLRSKRIRELFYDQHAKKLNRALYQSDLLYTPRVLFNRNGNCVFSNVITCAAPNKKAAQKYQHVSDDEVSKAMYHRLDSILHAASLMKVDCLILGAFGCGVFGNDVEDVAVLAKILLEVKYKNCFREVIFPVPDTKSFNTMKRVLTP